MIKNLEAEIPRSSQYRLARAAALILFLASVVPAQGMSTPADAAPGAPAGSYPLSDLETVNLFNGNLNINLPFLKMGGRGSASVPVSLTIEQRWSIVTECESGINPPCYQYPSAELWSDSPNYSPGALRGRYESTEPNYACDPAGQQAQKTDTSITFLAPDGTEYELRDVISNGLVQTRTSCSWSSSFNRGRVFVTFDGTAATFISDTDIHDSPGVSSGVFYFRPSGYLILRDGTRYRFDEGRLSWVRDRNGDKITFTYTYNSFYSRWELTKITDSLNREATFEYDILVATPYSHYVDKINYKGFAGATRTIQVHKAFLSYLLRAGYSIQTYIALFPDISSSSSPFNPYRFSEVELPNGSKYKFQYNYYGELARVELPTGGAIEYDFAQGWYNGPAIGTSDPYRGSTVRRLIERRVYKEGNAQVSRTTYSRPVHPGPTWACIDWTDGYVTVDAYDANSPSNLLTTSKHYFHDNLLSAPPSISYCSPPYEPPMRWAVGKEYKTEAYSATGSLLRRTEHTWAQKAPLFDENGKEIPNDPRITQTVSTLADSGQVSKKTFSYDNFNNVTDVYEYDYGSGAPAVNYTRRTHTDYLTINPVNGASYHTVNPNTTSPDINATYHLRSLPKQVSVYDSGLERARTTYEYDNYANDANHAALTPRSNISGLCTVITSPTVCDNTNPPGFVNRGNVTASTRYLLVNGAITGSVSAYQQFDIAGNVLKAIDARGYATNFDFSDCYGSPDGNARLNSGPIELGSQVSYAFPTKVTNAAGHVAYTQFDYYLGKPVDGEDANGVVSSGYYEDLLERPTKLISAANPGTLVKAQTLFSYDNVLRKVTTTNDLNSFSDQSLKSEILYDGLGRTTEKRQYETATTYITVETKYDALGRSSQVSNPYRAGETKVWTTTAYDALSRVISDTTPDNAVMTTGYSGNAVTVTDQIGKPRRSIADALGRLTRVDEPDASNNLGSVTSPTQPTSYSYDVLDNLLTVSQGSQTRSFVYDSLKRLTSATNPENGTISYQYDNNGNLTQRTDARVPAVVSTYTYDALNRNITVNYSDTTTVNPDITRYYDGAVNGKGRFWYDYAGGDFTNGSTVEHHAIDSYDALGRPLVQRQVFKTSGAWGLNYQTQRTYDLAGHVRTQTYPSGHVVTYNYDGAGRLGDKDAQNLAFAGNLGDGVTRNYATGIIYSPWNTMSKEQFGTTTPVYNKLFYNSRGQLSEIRESTSYTGPTDTSWNRGAIVNQYSFQCWGAACNGTDNNGNLKKQEVYVPANDQVTSYTSWYQQYDYDNLNRLLRVHEYTGTPSLDWQQEYVDDRWGNRLIHQTNTWGTGIPKPNFGSNTGDEPSECAGRLHDGLRRSGQFEQ